MIKNEGLKNRTLMQKTNLRKKSKASHRQLKIRTAGSITLEACVALPIFLCFFFMLLYIIRLACLLIALDHAATQTAKHLAACSYPLSFVNDYIDECFEDEGLVIKLINKAGKKGVKEIRKQEKNNLADILMGSVQEELLNGMLNDFKNSLSKEDTDGFNALIRDFFLTHYEALTNDLKYGLTQDILTAYLDSALLDPQQVEIRFLELPKGKAEFKYRWDDPLYEIVKMDPVVDFSNDDVVIQIEYPMRIPIPFFQDKYIKLRSTAVERAWLHGGNGVYTKAKEGPPLSEYFGNKTYYRARTGKKYHAYYYCEYLNKSCIPITLEEALEKGLTYHENCPYRF